MNTPMTKFAIMRANRDKTGYFLMTLEKRENAGKADRWAPTWHAPDVLIAGGEEQTPTNELIPRTEVVS